MRTLAVTQNITVDGSIEMLGDWFDPQGTAEDPSDILAKLAAQTARSDALLLGRRTFEDFRGYWPEQTDDRTGVAASLDEQAKVVVSATIGDPRWRGTTVIADDPIASIARMKAEPGAHIIVTGSITLTHALFEAGLVDEVRLFTYPVVQGGGRRLFPDGFAAPRLDLVESTSFRGGITYAGYAIRR